ncbi:urease accessory protein UreF [Methylomicrobium album BG8]|uniref:Urease accessory protein UreF n=3 Tax=Methylomicrobium TaxID=39773 RepID=H8GNX8_METAL|nr:urease accessory protein UreF [Methylomicrobium album BG8]
MRMATDLPLLRLLQLASPGLPVGMYSYSQGLEKAVDDGLIHNAATAGDWIGAVLNRSVARADLPVLARLYEAGERNDAAGVEYWSGLLLSCRESAELRAEDRQTGQALQRLLAALDLGGAAVPAARSMTWAALFGLAALRLGVAKREAMLGYAWSWLENQVLCAVKLVPLGQVAGQQLLLHLAEGIPAAVDRALRIDDDQIGGGVFGLALASSRHEMQYSRLFRS